MSRSAFIGIDEYVTGIVVADGLWYIYFVVGRVDPATVKVPATAKDSAVTDFSVAVLLLVD